MSKQTKHRMQTSEGGHQIQLLFTFEESVPNTNCPIPKLAGMPELKIPVHERGSLSKILAALWSVVDELPEERYSFCLAALVEAKERLGLEYVIDTLKSNVNGGK